MAELPHATRLDGADGVAKKKRRRPALSCEQCRRRKIRCDRLQPCSHCIKSKIPDCSYVPTHVPASWVKKAELLHERPPSPPQPRPILPVPDPKEPSAGPSSEDVATTSSRDIVTTGTSKDSSVHYLEEKLTQVVTLSPSSREELTPPNSNAIKARYFGRGHWLRCTALLSVEQQLLIATKAQESEFWQMMGACKSLARAIKKKRMQPLSSLELGRRVPSRHVADELVEIYLRTFEGVLRILHVPTFRAEYEQYWNHREATPDYFMIQLQLVMALGASMYDDTFSMRSVASQWLLEAQLWLMLPPEKNRLTIAGIQVVCLLTLARSVCAVGYDLAWISSGSLIRKAIYCGLHRDPRSLQGNMTTYRAEMRRRLWATILELNLQASFDAAFSTMISSADYDVLPPANLDDEDLDDRPDVARDSPPAQTKVTSMSIPLELLRSHALRQGLFKHANDFAAGLDYDETLRLNSAMTKACRTLTQNLATLSLAEKGKPNPKISDFHTSLTELLVYRCFSTLHQPYILKSLESPKLYFSRKMYLDSALKITSICGLSGQARATGPGGDDAPTSDFHRLLVNGSGVFRNILLQALPGIIFELTLIDENSANNSRPFGLGYLPAMGDRDLHATVDAGAKWLLRRVHSGETNIKGYLFFSLGRRHIEALEAGMDKESIGIEIRKSAASLLQESFEALQDLAAREGAVVDEEDQGNPLKEPALEDGNTMMTMDFVEDWTWDDLEHELWGTGPPVFEDVLI